MVRVSPFFNIIWGNELVWSLNAIKHFGAFFLMYKNQSFLTKEHSITNVYYGLTT